MKEPSVLGILGSARRRGNSWTLLGEVLAGAREVGARTRILWPAGVGFAPCRACDLCSRDGECVIRDRAWEAYRLLAGASAVVVVTPVYFGGIPAQLKALIDRGQAVYFRKYRLGQGRDPRPGALLCVSARNDPAYPKSCSTVIRTWFRVLDIELVEERFFPGYEDPGAIAVDREARAWARGLGRRLIQGIPWVSLRAGL